MKKEKKIGGGSNSVAFYSREKKPKLYNALAVALAVAALIPVIRRTNGDYADRACVGAIAIGLVVINAMLWVALKRQMEYNPYSYNTVMYFGFAIFLIFITIMHIRISVPLFTDPKLTDIRIIFSYVSGSALTFVTLSLPFIVLFSIFLIASNLVLIRREGGGFRNVLGILFSVAFLAGWTILWRVTYYFSGSETEVMIFECVTNVLAILVLYAECMLIGTIFANVVTVRYRPEYDKDYIIILGCGMRKDGTPRPLLAGRIDRAMTFSREQYDATGRTARFVVSGGKGSDEPISEAQCMKNYLISNGVPEEQIILEDKSTNTLENMKFSKEKIIAFGDASAKVAFSTSGYHVFRSGIAANRNKLKAVGIAAPTKWYFWPNAAVREFIGLLSAHRGKQIFLFVGLFVAFTTFTLLSYLL